MIERTVEQRLISYLVDQQVDFASIGRTLAKEHPEIFLGIVEGTLSVNQLKMRYAAVIKQMREGATVVAIKELRIATGWGLKEAMEVIRHAMYRAVMQGVILPIREDEKNRLYEHAATHEVAIRRDPERLALAQSFAKILAS